ncbi:YihY/virulence factor BrkB family protein [Mangrovimicrobium sediminis]|uniref:YihY/virulence factor BrkB family protein n=1 Tax=Mangrovimicrobium sediminis TaxID=2562682 RepID=A0A4Z0LYF4_9GAMM|nr:YihY/virulence factor BrkB family protein [Haliea sp. SAOS-164]TGD72311.1 YihY/virulence factor BrkB family protein [Haliea sp. SAOS-164]
MQDNHDTDHATFDSGQPTAGEQPATSERSTGDRLLVPLLVVRDAAAGFMGDKCFRFSAALSFYTLFSIAPMVLISIYVAGLAAADIDFQAEITRQFSVLIGDQAADGVTVLLSSLQNQEQTRFQLFLSGVVLLFSATNIFVQLQDAYNDIYSVQAKPGRGLVKQFLDRMISLGMILSLGFLLLVSLIIDSAVVSLRTYLFAVLNDAAIVVVSLLQNAVLIALVTGIIYALFHFLPDVEVPRKHKLRGSLAVTAMLLLGKYGIGVYIGNSSLSELGGASASVIVLMLWIYYTSLILFFGAELIKAMARHAGDPLKPRRYATAIRTVTARDWQQPAERAS